jgi:uncharacterized protein YjbJ (UPF0337 family)
MDDGDRSTVAIFVFAPWQFDFGTRVAPLFCDGIIRTVNVQRAREEDMGIFNDDEAKGKWEQAKGTIKDKVGEVTGDEELEAEGEVQHAEGEAQESWGSVKRGVSDVVHDIGDAINK